MPKKKQSKNSTRARIIKILRDSVEPLSLNLVTKRVIEVSGSSISQQAVTYNLEKLIGKNLVKKTKQADRCFYVLSGSGSKSGRVVQLQKPLKDKCDKEPKYESIENRVEGLSLDRWSILLSGVFPGQVIIPAHIDRVRRLLRQNKNLLNTLIKMEIIPSGKEELEKCREERRRLTLQVEQLSVELTDITVKLSEATEEIKRTKGIIELRDDTIARLENCARKASNSRVHDNALVVFGEK